VPEVVWAEAEVIPAARRAARAKAAFI
jgi:hypothetical protein